MFYAICYYIILVHDIRKLRKSAFYICFLIDRNPVNTFILEEAINVFVMLVSATDLDSTSNGAITYSVNSTSFNMDSTTGRLTTNAALDRETTPSFTIMICASDQGSTALSVCESVSLLYFYDLIKLYLKYV